MNSLDCLQRAEEAEQLARLVSYGRDKQRLLDSAVYWRTRAAELRTTEEQARQTSE